MILDNQLLEFASRAFGFTECDFLRYEYDGLINVYDNDGRQSAWNPLHSDGDALRLAAKLDLTIQVGKFSVAAVSYEHDVVGRADKNDDVSAAWRRAITIAAAEIGQKINDKRNC